MLFNKFFVFLGILNRKPCLSEKSFGRNQLNGFHELEETAMKIIKNCCLIQEKTKTLALIGDIPRPFIKRLSSDQSFSTILLDYRGRIEDIVKRVNEEPITIEKIEALIAIAPEYRDIEKMMWAFVSSRYFDTNTFVVMLGWSPENRYAGCDGSWRTHRILRVFHHLQMANAILICRNNPKGLKIFTFNGYTNYAPQPWQFVLSMNNWKTPMYCFVREYQNNMSICENHFFDKIHHLQGAPIKIFVGCQRPPCESLDQTMRTYSKGNKGVYFEQVRRKYFLREFISYVNATEKVVSYVEIVGKPIIGESDTILARPVYIRGIHRQASAMYPHGTDCKFIVTQFQGNKSQMRKIYDIIDIYSWIGTLIVYLITLIFFKYFVGQSFMIGILNLCRLSANCGIITLNLDHKSRMYLACLFFFIITMQGILTGNLAALLTHDVPVRQINSIQDLANFGYTVYAEKFDYIHFHDPAFKGRIVEKLEFDNCIRFVKGDHLTACLTWGTQYRAEALESNLHVSDCVVIEYVTNAAPKKWPLENEMNKFLGLTISGNLMVDFGTMVGEKILLDIESMEIISDPQVMTMSDLGFVFAILGIGSGCALISFIAEIILHRFKRRVMLSRVIVLK